MSSLHIYTDQMAVMNTLESSYGTSQISKYRPDRVAMTLVRTDQTA
jgi:hypothetical protein